MTNVSVVSARVIKNALGWCAQYNPHNSVYTSGLELSKDRRSIYNELRDSPNLEQIINIEMCVLVVARSSQNPVGS